MKMTMINNAKVPYVQMRSSFRFNIPCMPLSEQATPLASRETTHSHINHRPISLIVIHIVRHAQGAVPVHGHHDIISKDVTVGPHWDLVQNGGYLFQQRFILFC